MLSWIKWNWTISRLQNIQFNLFWNRQVLIHGNVSWCKNTRWPYTNLDDFSLNKIQRKLIDQDSLPFYDEKNILWNYSWNLDIMFIFIHTTVLMFTLTFMPNIATSNQVDFNFMGLCKNAFNISKSLHRHSWRTMCWVPDYYAEPRTAELLEMQLNFLDLFSMKDYHDRSEMV